MLTESSFKGGASSAAFAESAPRPLIDRRLRPELAKWDPLPRASGEIDVDYPVVQMSPPDLVDVVPWHGVPAESVQCTSWDKVEYRFSAPAHLLVAYEKGERWSGETFIEGDGLTTVSVSPVASRPLDSYPTARKIKVSICRQDGVLTIGARMIDQLRIG
jgi:hypothetical protein